MVTISKEDLEQYIFIDNLSYESIGKLLGCTGGYVRKYAKKLGIILPKRRTISASETFNKAKNAKQCLTCGKQIPSNHKYCSKSCQQRYYYKIYIEKWTNGEENGSRGEYSVSRRIRKYILEKNEYKCEKCGWCKINEYTGYIPLELHHKDGNYLNNQEDNLELLCPNCHSLTSTFKNHNKNGRKGRKKYK